MSVKHVWTLIKFNCIMLYEMRSSCLHVQLQLSINTGLLSSAERTQYSIQLHLVTDFLVCMFYDNFTATTLHQILIFAPYLGNFSYFILV